MYLPAIALPFAATVLVASAYPIKADGVNCRSGPGTSYDVVKSYSLGTEVTLTCQTTGTNIFGDNLWGKTTDGCYVADYYVKTGTADYVTKKCDSDRASTYPVNADALNCRSGPGTSYGVVKTYSKGTELSLTCQTTGTSVYGHNLWDKTSDGCYVSDYYVETGTGDYVTDKCDSDGDDGSDDGGNSGGNLPGLDSTQSAHARDIIGEAKDQGLGRQGCLAAIATALVESNILIYANRKVPESLNYPYDRIGSDHDSVGIFQQRAIYYPDIAADMDPARSAAQFFKKMTTISGWQTMNVGTLCQKVQVSAYPDRYGQRVPEAEKICQAGGL